MNWLTYHRQLLQFAKTSETLTPSQASTRDSILNAIHRLEGRINVWGNPGVGKTFLAHYLHHRADLLYFSSPACYNRRVSSDSTVAIDNAPHGRQESRRLDDEIRWSGKDYSAVTNVILITQRPIDDAVHPIELTLTDTDVAHIEHLLQQDFGESDFEPVSEYARQCSGLWRYVKNLAQRG